MRVSVYCPECKQRRRHQTRLLLIAWHSDQRARLWFWCTRCDDGQSIALQPPSALAFQDAFDLPVVDLYTTPLERLPDLYCGILLWLRPAHMRHALEAELDQILANPRPFNWRLDDNGRPRRVNPPEVES